MAYMNQETKKELSPGIKRVLKKYDMKGTISVRDHMKLVVNIKSGRLDILGASKKAALKDLRFDHTNEDDVRQLNFILGRKWLSVNTYWYKDHYGEDEEVVGFLDELVKAMKGPGYFNDSDSSTDYSHCSHYIDINVGLGNDKPYVCTGKEATFERVEVQESA